MIVIVTPYLIFRIYRLDNCIFISAVVMPFFVVELQARVSFMFFFIAVVFFSSIDNTFWQQSGERVFYCSSLVQFMKVRENG